MANGKRQCSINISDKCMKFVFNYDKEYNYFKIVNVVIVSLKVVKWIKNHGTKVIWGLDKLSRMSFHLEVVSWPFDLEQVF